MPSEKLEFTKQEPSFLRRLREQHGGVRNNVQIARPKKDRLRTGDEDEDDPVIVDESGENVAKEEWEGMLKREKGGEMDDAVGEDAEKNDGETVAKVDEAPKEGQKTADIGATKKRKAARVIADDEGERDGNDTESKQNSGAGEPVAKTKEGLTSTRSKKKAKKIKLSFDDEPE